jgi:hypothetical protein
MTKSALFALFAVLLIALSACAQQNTLKAQPINKTVAQTASCEGVACGQNQYCDAGQCLCEGGFKTCGSACIGQAACCGNRDCPSDRTCNNGACVQRQVCAINEEWNAASQECICDEDSKFCSEQGKCIPRSSCCWHTSCDEDQRCALTVYAGTICLKADTKKCRVVHEGRTLGYTFAQGDFDIRLNRVLEGPKFDVKVNNDSVRRVSIGEQNVVANNVQLYVENITTYGGGCRDEPD